MLMPPSKALLEEHFRDRTIETVLGSLGLSAAVVSASFAAYMVVVGPGRGVAPADVHPPVQMAGLSPRIPAAALPTTPPGDIDFMPTGTIPGLGADIDPEPEASGSNPDAVLADFAVRDVFDGTALVEAHGTLQIVKPGSVIEGAGEVLSIKRRGSAWLVMTAGGVIEQRR